MIDKEAHGGKPTLIKLMGGNEVLGLKIAEDATTITLYMPQLLVTVVYPDDLPHFHIIPYSMYSKVSVFNRNLIISTAIPVTEILVEWIKAVDAMLEEPEQEFDTKELEEEGKIISEGTKSVN